MYAVISCGGKGERLLPIETPKSLIEINGKTVLEWQIEGLVSSGVTDIILLTGYGSELIYEKFFDYKKARILFSKEKKPLGNFGGIIKIREMIDEDFIFLYGDIIFDFDFHDLIYRHKLNRSFITSVLHRTTHPKDSNLVFVDADQRIIKIFDKGHIIVRCLSMAGIHMISKEAIHNNKLGVIDFEKDILIPELTEKKIMAFVTESYIKDMGTHERLEEVRNEFKRTDSE